MKREKLKEIGLTEEQTEAVMAAYGQSVQSLNSQITTLQQSETDLKEQITKHAADLKKLQKDNSDNEELKNQIKQLQKEHAEQEAKYQESLIAVQRDAALTSLLHEVKAKNPKAVSALLDQEKIIFKDGELSGVKEQLEALQESDGYLFESGKPSGYQPNGGKSTGELTYSTLEEAMEKGDVDTFFKEQAEMKESEE